MKGISWKSQLGLVAFACAGVLGLATVLIFERYLQYLNHPEDVAASSGMYAGGDLLLEIFIGGMLLAVTFFLVLVIAKSEPALHDLLENPAYTQRDCPGVDRSNGNSCGKSRKLNARLRLPLPAASLTARRSGTWDEPCLRPFPPCQADYELCFAD